MKLLDNKYFPIGVTVIAFLVTALMYPVLPERIASHWGIDGQVNGYMSKFWGAYFMPFISVFMLGLFYVIPKIDPMKNNIMEFEKHFLRFISVLFLFLFYLHLLVLGWNWGMRFEMTRMLAPAFATLMLAIGSLMENSKPNWSIGIRTPWTMSSPVVWEKTHKLGGKLIKIAGGVSLLGILLPQLALWLILVPMLSWAAFLFWYSYKEYQKI